MRMLILQKSQARLFPFKYANRKRFFLSYHLSAFKITIVFIHLKRLFLHSCLHFACMLIWFQQEIFVGINKPSGRG